MNKPAPSRRFGLARAKAAFLAAALILSGAVDASALAVPQPRATGGYYSGNSSYVKVTWSGVSGANKYYVFRSASTSWSKRIKVKTVSKSTRALYDYTAKPGVKYYYWVCPVRKPSFKNGYKSKYYYSTGKYAKGERALGTVKPTASYNTYSAYVYLSWSSVANAKRYKIKRSTSPYFSSSRDLAITTNRHYYDTSATPGVKYYYWVLGSTGNGSFWYNSSKYTSGMRASSGLTAPKPVFPSMTSYPGSVTLRWTRVSGQYPTRYAIYRSYSSGTHPGNGATYVGTVSSTDYGINSWYYFYDDSVPYVNYTYYYWVCPVDSSGTCWYSASNYGKIYVY